MSDELLYLSATELLDAYGRGRVSPVEAVDAALARIEALQPTVNAFVTVCGDDARKAARDAEAALSSGEGMGALAGVPYSVKDLVPTAGVRTTFGSAVFRGNVPDRDAVAVARLKRAGGILLGKTTTPALGHKGVTTSLLSGVSRNPWNLERTCGGSSGGAAAAVASGQGPLALGTDGGGSVRIPASACGVVGLKPTLGRVPQDSAPDPFGTLSFIGPMTRTVADAALMLSVMAGPDASDPWSRGQPALPGPPFPETPPPPGNLRAAWFPLLGNSVIDGGVKGVVERAVRNLSGLGLDVEPEEDVLEAGDAMWRAIGYSAQYARMASHLEATPDLIDPSLKTNMEEGMRVGGPDLQNALFARGGIYRAIERVFGSFDLMVTPTLAAPPPAADFDAHEDIEIEGARAGRLRAAWYAYTHPFNMSGHPAITLPCGWTDDGLPVGVQLVAPWYREDLLLRVAAAFERAHPWADRRPGV